MKTNLQTILKFVINVTLALPKVFPLETRKITSKCMQSFLFLSARKDAEHAPSETMIVFKIVFSSNLAFWKTLSCVPRFGS